LFLIISAANAKCSGSTRQPMAPFPPERSKCYSVGVDRALISGASGLMGSALVPSLESHGFEVTRLVRRGAPEAGTVHWDPMRAIPPELISGFDVVIHLSGENVAGRWTATKKACIRESRVVSTKNLSEALAKAERPPKAFLCASAIGYYGNRGDEVLTEESPSGDGFLPEVCREWESATEPATNNAAIRVVNLRTGLVLSPNGGPLKPMLLPFRLGLGGRIGSGSQWWSWIHIEDFVSAVHHILQDTLADPEMIAPPASTVDPIAVDPEKIVERRASSPGLPLSGPINMVSPSTVTNAEFTKTLAKVLKRPAILPVPAFAARLALGELADEALLASARVEPKKLIERGFEFQYPNLESAVRNLL
jgi:uncharacterized protein